MFSVKQEMNFKYYFDEGLSDITAQEQQYFFYEISRFYQ
jgi:hypothetical protein